MFLDAKLTAATNRHVTNGPEDRLPVFKRNYPGRVDVGGSILRYASTTPDVKRG